MITVHGNKEDISLPSMGNKLLGVKRGTVDIHGKVLSKTWTNLEKTVNAGEFEIEVQGVLADWNVGDEIVIATTKSKD